MQNLDGNISGQNWATVKISKPKFIYGQWAYELHPNKWQVARTNQGLGGEAWYAAKILVNAFSIQTCNQLPDSFIVESIV